MAFHKIVVSNEEKNKDLYEKIKNKIEGKFPLKGNFRELYIKNIKIEDTDSGYSRIKQAISNKTSVTAKVTATLILKDKKGKILDSKNIPILRIPIVTKKNNFTIDGNSYAVINQQRLKSGIYTYKRGDGVTYTTVKPKNGREFKIYVSENDRLKIKTSSKSYDALSILNRYGISISEINKIFNKDIVKGESSDAKIFDDFKKDVYFSEDNNLEFNEEVNGITTGVKSSKLNKNLLLASMNKLNSVNLGEEKEDEPENMIFKTIVTSNNLVSEQYEKSLKDVLYKLRFKLNNKNTKKVNDLISSSSVLSKPLKQTITSIKLSRIPDEYNPINSAMFNYLITPMGEGGVGDSRALGLKQKAVHHSQLGFIDPVVSPEGSSVGITLAVTKNSYVDDNGNPAIKVINAKTGKKEIKTLLDLWKSKLQYPITAKDNNTIRVGEEDKKLKKGEKPDFIIPSVNDLHSPASNFIPLMDSIDANRANMAQKHIQQTLPLDDPDIPHVHTAGEDGNTGNDIVKETGTSLFSKWDGIISKIDKEYIYIKTKDKTEKVEYAIDVPFSTKTFLSHYIKVKVGDRVRKGSLLADSNFSKNGTLAIGKNLRTAWISMPGNRNDGVIISESASEKLKSVHIYKETVDITPKDILSIKKSLILFPNISSKIIQSKYDEKGIIKKGEKLSKNEPMVIKITPNEQRTIKSKLSDAIQKPYSIVLTTWKKQDEGEVLNTTLSGNTIVIEVKVKSKAKEGDKLSARAGNKGIISKIVPDDMMPKTEDGKHVEMALTAAGVVSRVNPGTIEEGAIGKVAEKKGTDYIIERYGLKNNLEESKKLLNDTFKQSKETLINPETGKPFPNKVFVGNPYIIKLFKDGEGATSSVGIGATDQNEQAVKGGKESASSISNMEVNSLLAYNAHNLLSDIRDVNGQKNDEYFKSFMSGSPIMPRTDTPYTFKKFTTLLEQLNVKVEHNKENKTFDTKMISSKDVIKNSSGEVKSSETIDLKSKKPIKNGLFDDKIFGGISGKKSGYIKLPEPIINPLHKDEISYILGIQKKEFNHKIENGDIESIVKELSKIDEDKKIKEYSSKIKVEDNLDNVNKEIKALDFLKNIKRSNLSIKDASTISAIPVIPPSFRPVSIDKREVSMDQLNVLYKDIIDISSELKKNPKENNLKRDLYLSVGALYGTNKSPNPAIDENVTKGVLPLLKGENPKQSFAQRALIRKKQFMSGRGVIKPAKNDISIDEIELPENIALNMYKPHIIRNLTRKGMDKEEIEDLIEKKDPKVISALHDSAKEYPVYYTRSPALWKHNILGANPIITKGSTIGVNQLLERNLGADYDGDQIAVYATSTKKAADEVRNKLFPSKYLFTEGKNNHDPDLLIKPTQDSSLGFFKASRPSHKKTQHISNISELLKDLKSGKIDYNDKVIIR